MIGARHVLLGVAACALAGCKLLFEATAVDAGVAFDGRQPDPDAVQPDASLPLLCPSSYDVEVLGSKYRVVANATDWLQAQTACQNDGATNGSTHLAVLDDGAELIMLQAVTSVFNTNVWVGLTDVRTEGTFRAIVMSPPDFPKDPPTSPPWGVNKPDDVIGDRDCVFIQANSGRLDDDSCAELHAYVCECDRNVVDTAGFPPTLPVK
jgi:hypothetical protein